MINQTEIEDFLYRIKNRSMYKKKVMGVALTRKFYNQIINHSDIKNQQIYGLPILILEVEHLQGEQYYMFSTIGRGRVIE